MLGALKLIVRAHANDVIVTNVRVCKVPFHPALHGRLESSVAFSVAVYVIWNRRSYRNQEPVKRATTNQQQELSLDPIPISVLPHQRIQQSSRSVHIEKACDLPCCRITLQIEIMTIGSFKVVSTLDRALSKSLVYHHGLCR